MEKRKICRKFWISLVLLPVAMFGFGFALVPLYSVFCDLTGLNGKTNEVSFAPTLAYDIDDNRKVSVDFLANSATGFQVRFYPKIKQQEIVPGRVYTVNYIAENHSDQIITGQAIPSVAPGVAAQYFKKIECFCFHRQTFKPHDTIEMPVTFVVEPALDKSVLNISLSYSFFKINEPQASRGKGGPDAI